MNRTLALASLLLTLAVGGPLPSAGAVPVPVRPDGLVRRANESQFWGNGIYNDTGAGQTRAAQLRRGRPVSFYVQLQNDGTEPTELRVTGTAESAAFAVRYFFNGTRVSTQVKAGTFVVGPVPPGGYRTLRVEVEATRLARPGARRRILVRSVSVDNTSMDDTVRATVRIPLYTAEQQRIAELINTSRQAHGRRPLIFNRTLTTKAQNWAEYLARANALIHSDLTAGAPAGWEALAENVGYGQSIIVVHRAFMASSGHRHNILGYWSQIGTGYANRNGRIFIVQEFMR